MKSILQSRSIDNAVIGVGVILNARSVSCWLRIGIAASRFCIADIWARDYWSCQLLSIGRNGKRTGDHFPSSLHRKPSLKACRVTFFAITVFRPVSIVFLQCCVQWPTYAAVSSNLDFFRLNRTHVNSYCENCYLTQSHRLNKILCCQFFKVRPMYVRKRNTTKLA